VIKFFSSLAHLHAACSLLLACVNTAVSPATHKRTPIRWNDGSVDSTVRVCAYSLVVGFVSLALPFYRELELRGDDAEPHVRERMRLFRLQAREMVVLGVREIARVLGYLPMVHYTPMNWRIICSWAEFCLECPPESATDLKTCVNLYLCSLVCTDCLTAHRIANEMKLMGYSLDIFSSPHATELIGRLDGYQDQLTWPFQDFFNSADLEDLFLPLEQPWTQVPGPGDEIPLDPTQNSCDPHFTDVVDE
jgi:hypothetical protein